MFYRLGTYQICDTHGLTKDKNGNSSVIRSMAIGALGGAIGASSGSPFYLVCIPHLLLNSNNKHHLLIVD